MDVTITLPEPLAERLQNEAQTRSQSLEDLAMTLLDQALTTQAQRREAMLQIMKFSEQIAREFKPERIILFGSWAYGVPREGSDIDLLVIMPYAARHTEQAIRIHEALRTLAPIDLLVRTPEELSERLAKGDSFMRAIVERGKVLYEANHPGMD